MSYLDALPFHYCMELKGREFLISIDPKGIIHWEDTQGRQRTRKDDAPLELLCMLGDEKAGRTLENETSEFTVSFELPKDIFELIALAATCFEHDAWTVENEKTLDSYLEPIFWEQVVPLLNDSPGNQDARPQ